MKSEPEPKPRQVAMAAFYLEPVAPGQDKEMGTEHLGLPGPTSPSELTSPQQPRRGLQGSLVLFFLTSAPLLGLFPNLPPPLLYHFLLRDFGILASKLHLNLNHWLHRSYWENPTQHRTRLTDSVFFTTQEGILIGQLRSHAHGAFDWQFLLHSLSPPHPRDLI